MVCEDTNEKLRHECWHQRNQSFVKLYQRMRVFFVKQNIREKYNILTITMITITARIITTMVIMTIIK